MYCLGEANFSDHGANRLGASALMQGLADGYFVIPYTVGNYLADEIRTAAIPTSHPAFEAAEKAVPERIETVEEYQGKSNRRKFSQKAGQDHVGKMRHGAEMQQGLKEAIEEIRELKKEFWSDLKVPGEILRNESRTGQGQPRG